MTDLNRLIYVSTAVGGSDVDLWALTSILHAAERNNLQHGLSGLLLAHGGAFCQVVEGSRQDIDGLMSILARDRRHTDIRVLCDIPVTRRQFGRWTMAQVIITPDLAGDLDGIDVRDFQCESAMKVMALAGERMMAA